MDSVNMHPERKAVCPLFDFQISEVLIGKYTHEESMEYFSMLREKFEEGIEVLENVRIRRIRNEDLQRLRNYRSINLLTLYPNVFSRIDQRTFVVEFLGKGIDDAPEVESVIHKILLGMRLYKPISVFCKTIWFEDNSEIEGLATLDTFLPETSYMALSYTPEVEEIEEIGEILKKLTRMDFDRRKSFHIACERFSRAHEEHQEDQTMIDLVIALEALFLGGKKTSAYHTGELIGLGCSILLGENDEDRRHIYRFLVRAYNIRNKIVHGSEYKTPIQVDGEEYSKYAFIVKLRNYLSESIRKLID